MKDKGLSLMGTGVASGTERALKAARAAISSPLLEDVSIDGATGIIINITGDKSLSLNETNSAVSLIMEAADEDAEIIFGTVIDENMGENVKITVIATGLRNAKTYLTSTSNGYASRPVMTEPTPVMETVRPAPVTPAAPVAEPVRTAPVAPAAPKMETRAELPAAAPAPAARTDYAVKEEMSFDFDRE